MNGIAELSHTGNGALDLNTETRLEPAGKKRGCKTFCVSGVFRKDKENAYGREEQVGCSVG